MQEIQISMREIQGKSKMGLTSNIVHHHLDFDQFLEQSLIFLCKVTARKTQARKRRSRGGLMPIPIPIPYNIYCSIKSWFAIAMAELRTRRILRQKADFKQSNHNFTVAK